MGAAEQSETTLVTPHGKKLRVGKFDTLPPRTALDAGEVAERSGNGVAAATAGAARPANRVARHRGAPPG
jgi:hypothetical protein